MPTPSSQTWDEPALIASETTRSALEGYLIRRSAEDGHTELVEWMLRSAVRLPSALNPGFHDGLAPVLADTGMLLRAFSQGPSRAAAPLAKAIVEWFAS
jgi:hypothetical protein